MNPVAKLLTFAVCLLLVFGGGWALGRAVGPVVDDPPAPTTATSTTATSNNVTTDTGAHPAHGGG